MTTRLKIILNLSGYILVALLSAYITAAIKDKNHLDVELNQQLAFNEQLVSKTKEYKKAQDKLIEESSKKIKELEEKNKDLEKKWTTANAQRKNAQRKYNKLLKEGWVLKDEEQRLSTSATKFLVEMAIDADLVVNQLKITQEYALNLRKTCLESSIK